MTRRIAVVNTGASSLKVALMEAHEDGFRAVRCADRQWTPADADALRDVGTALDALGAKPDAIGHRFVHGGRHFVAPVRLTGDVESALEELAALAPLHNAPALAAIRATRRRHPDVPAVAVFDTAFHAGRPPESMQYALAADHADHADILRYGFHGLAHESLLESVAAARGEPAARISAVTLQLGAGCSACAIRAGQSIETSMGFSPLEGLVMATRSGNIDPAVVFHLLRRGASAGQLEDELTRRAGLLGLCGSADMREVLAAAERNQKDAKLALCMFCYRIVLTVGGYLTLLDGDGAIVFGGGIGANSPEVRARVARGLACWGVELDAAKNERNEPGLVSTPDSRPVFAFHTNEEAVIARRTAALVWPGHG